MEPMSVLETHRLFIRPFRNDDLEAIHIILDIDLAGAPLGNEGANTLEERRAWLQWTVLNYEQLFFRKNVTEDQCKGLPRLKPNL